MTKPFTHEHLKLYLEGNLDAKLQEDFERYLAQDDELFRLFLENTESFSDDDDYAGNEIFDRYVHLPSDIAAANFVRDCLSANEKTPSGLLAHWIQPDPDRLNVPVELQAAGTLEFNVGPHHIWIDENQDGRWLYIETPRDSPRFLEVTFDTSDDSSTEHQRIAIETPFQTYNENKQQTNYIAKFRLLDLVPVSIIAVETMTLDQFVNDPQNIQILILSLREASQLDTDMIKHLENLYEAYKPNLVQISKRLLDTLRNELQKGVPPKMDGNQWTAAAKKLNDIPSSAKRSGSIDNVIQLNPQLQHRSF
jgi:hypothetical protein